MDVWVLKAQFKSYAQFKFAIELDPAIAIPKEIRTWLLIKDSPFEATHIMYVNKAIKKHVVAFEHYNDACYFIAWMEQLEVDTLK